MNFLIAVIGESYSKVIQNKEAFDYQQRATMINELESYFTEKHLSDPDLFPKILVVRKPKLTSEPAAEGNSKIKKMLIGIKNFIKKQNEASRATVKENINDGFKNLSSSIKVLEMDIQNINKDLESMQKKIWENTMAHKLRTEY